MLRTFSRRSRWWLAMVQVALMLALLALPAAAASDPAPLTGPQLIQLLQHYGIVKGDHTGNLNLDKPITRAEMITIMVRALGLESEAPQYMGWNVFDDAKGHWAEGNISLAASRGLVRGDGNRTVRPDDSITYAEALTLLLRVLDKEPTIGDWPYNVIISAADLGLLPAGVTAGELNQPAVRGLIFQSMAKGITTVTAEDGKTFLQKHVDSTPPKVSLESPPATTSASSVRITGTMEDAASVTVNGQPASISGNSFSADVTLEYGANKIAVEAFDRAGNKAVAEATVTRAHPISSLEISGPAKVAPGESATFTITAKDSSGNAVGLAGAVATVQGNIGTFDLATGVLKASSTPAAGSITITAGTVSETVSVEVLGPAASASRLSIPEINEGRSVSYTRPMTVTVQVLDAEGALVEDDYGRSVTLSASGLSGVTVTPTVAKTEAGVATFTVKSQQMGDITLVATAGDLQTASATATFGTNLRVQLTADPGSLVVGGSTGSSRIRANLVDEDGKSVTNETGSDIYILLSATGDAGDLIDDTIRIVRGASSSSTSGDEGTFSVGTAAGRSTVSGRITTGPELTVDPVSISSSIPSVGSGTTWDMLGNVTLEPGSDHSFSLRVTDSRGHTIPGSYAFQLSVSTSNNEKKTDGIPEGLVLTLGDTGLNPISDGIAESSSDDGDDVIVRTESGIATFRISYDKSGEVYLTVVPVGATNDAYNSDGEEGSASSSAGIAARSFTLTYAAAPTGLKLLVDSDGLGDGHAAGATTNSSSRRFTLHAIVTDGNGNWIPGIRRTVKLERVDADSDDVTNLPSTLTATTSDGKATFTVTATSKTGIDTYRISTEFTAGTPVYSEPVELQVQKTVPAAPTILAIRGVDEGLPGALDYVGSGDTDMEIELAQDPDQKWVVIKVYREGSGTVLYTSKPVDLSQAAPRIVVPKDVLPKGVSRFQVVARNGHGDSPKSLPSNQVTNAQFVTSIKISSAKYQRSTQLLTISGSGFSKNDTVSPGLIYIRDASTDTTVDLGGASVNITSSGQMVLDLSGTVAGSALDDPEQFSGNDVTITAGEAWYTRANGEQSEALATSAPVTPMAHIRHVVYDATNKRLYLEGQGFSKVSLNLTKLRLERTDSPETSPIELKGLSNSRTSDTRWTFTLSSSAAALLDAHSTYVLRTDDGWAYDSSWLQPALADVTIYGQVHVTSVSFTRSNPVMKLNGRGFTGGELTVSSLSVMDLSTGEVAALSGTYEIVSDTEIEITLDFGDPETAELNNAASFRGSDVYLLGVPGWFINAADREAAEIPLRTLRLPTLP